MSASLMSSAACTATMLPEPPSQLPHRAPRPIQASEPMTPFIMTKATTKPIIIVMAAVKKPSSILGPSLMILRMSQRSSMVKIMA